LISLAFAVVTLARYAATDDADALRIDMLQLCVTALALPWFIEKAVELAAEFRPQTTLADLTCWG
jgi:hypothetical protein